MKYEIVPYSNLIEKMVEFSNDLFPVKLGKELVKQYIIILSHGINTQTICSIRLLVIQNHANDCAVLLRSMFESTIDMGLLSSGAIRNDVERFTDFADVENYKLYSHMSKIKPELTREIENKNLKSNLNQRRQKMLSYKNKFHDINSWCGLNLLDRCKILDKYYSSTVNDNKFYEFLYCQVFRIGSCSTHRSYLGLRSAKLKKDNEINAGPWIFETNIDRLLHACRYAVYVYLSSLRFFGKVFNIEKCELFYQSMAGRLFSGKIAQLGEAGNT